MAPTPYSANSRMVFMITVSGIAHQTHIAVNSSLWSGSSSGYGLTSGSVPGGFVDPQNAANAFWGVTRPFYGSATPDPAWRLDRIFGGVFVPVAGDNSTIGTGSGSDSKLASVSTLTFKDSLNKRVNIRLSETNMVLPGRFALPGTNAALNAFAASVLSDDGTFAIGNWARSRGNDDIDRSLYCTVTLSKALRKLRNFL